MVMKISLFLTFLFLTNTISFGTQAQQRKATTLKQKHNLTTRSIKQQNPPGEYIARDSNSNQQYTLVQRDKNFPVLVFPGNIRQDSIIIANYTVLDDSWEGKIVKKFSFFIPNGTKAAEAIIIGISKDNCSIKTFRDNKVHDIKVNTIENAARVEILAKFLVNKGYL